MVQLLHVVKRIKILLLAGIILVTLLPVNGQEIFLRAGSPVFCHFSKDSHKNILIYPDHIIIHDLEGVSRDSIYVPSIGEMTLGHNIHFLYDRVTFSKKGSGYVYQVIDGKVTRIDRSLDHNFQQSAIEFVRNDTLFRHGGRGLWETRNFFSFFSNETYEWEVLRPVKGEEFPPGLFLHQAQLYEDDVFIFGGFTLNKIDPNKEEFNDIVWKFNFKEKSWTRLGKLSPAVLASTFGQERWRINDVTRVSEYDDKYVTTQQWLYKINLAKNKMWYLQAKHLIKRIEPLEPYEHFIFKDHIYFYEQENNHNFRQNYLIYRVPLSKVNDASADSEEFYIPDQSFSWAWALLGLPGLFAVFVMWNKNRPKEIITSKATLINNGIRFKEIEYSLSPTAFKVLSLLLSEPEDVPSSKIMEVTSRPGLDYPNQVRLKNQVIRTLNLELRSIFRTNEDLILQTSSAVDRRIKCYWIERSRFETKSEIHA